MKFIELDYAGDPIWVNPETIKVLVPTPRGSEVIFGPDYVINVTETPEDIMEKIGR